MGKQRVIFIMALTLAVVIILSTFIGYSIDAVNDRVIQSCFDELANSAQRLANELYDSIDIDRAMLAAIASTIAVEEEPDITRLCEILSAYRFNSSYISYLELLLPDNRMLDADGRIYDVSSALSFSNEVFKGEYISDICIGIRSKEEKLIRNAVPVKKNGNTIYMLYGVIRLDDLANKFTADIYGGKAIVYIEDGDSGDFILTPVAARMNNVTELTGNKLLGGFTWGDFLSDLKNGRNGRMGLYSETGNITSYMHYEPTGINNWNVMVTVTQESALENSRAVSSLLYIMAVVIGAVMFVYMLIITLCLFIAYRKVHTLGTIDVNTGLKNRNAYDKFVASRQKKLYNHITCIYIDANGLHEINNAHGHSAGDLMLRLISDSLQYYFRRNHIFRIGGDEFVLICEGQIKEECEMNMLLTVKDLEKHGYSISFGMVSRNDETGVDRVIREADEQMLANKREYYKTKKR